MKSAILKEHVPKMELGLTELLALPVVTEDGNFEPRYTSIVSQVVAPALAEVSENFATPFEEAVTSLSPTVFPTD